MDIESKIKRITQHFPCENCITLPICKFKEKKRGNIARVHDLCLKCHKIKDYVDVVDIPGENDPNDINTPCKLQGIRLDYIIHFMGWLKCETAIVIAEQKGKRTYVSGASPTKQKLLKLARSYYASTNQSKES